MTSGAVRAARRSSGLPLHRTAESARSAAAIRERSHAGDPPADRCGMKLRQKLDQRCALSRSARRMERGDQRPQNLNPRPPGRCAATFPAPPPRDTGAVGGGFRAQLVGEARFADAGLTGEQDEPPASAERVLQGGTQLGALTDCVLRSGCGTGRLRRCWQRRRGSGWWVGHRGARSGHARKAVCRSNPEVRDAAASCYP